MADETIFERRLAVALGRYAELAPAMDDEAIAREAIGAGQPGRIARWAGALQGMELWPAASRGLRAAYLVALVALLVAALIIAATAGGLLRNESLRPLGGNGAIVYSFTGNSHEPVASLEMGADGTGGRPIDAGRCPVYSRDGSALSWLSYDGTAASLVVAAPDGSRARTTLLVEDAQASVSYALSADGTRVAWFKPAPPGPTESPQPDGAPTPNDSRVDLWAAPLDGGEAARIVAASTIPGESYGSPLWSPDGRLIAFGVFVRDAATGEARRTAIDVVAADGSGRHRLTTRSGLLEDGMSWSPDGGYLAYAGLPEGPTASAPTGGGLRLADQQRDLYIVGADGTGDRALTVTAPTEHDPAWSPDGTFIAFEMSAQGVPDTVSVVQSEGAGPPALGPVSDWFVWSPDGRQLLWQELTAVGPETFRTTLHSIDSEFRQPPTTLQVVDGLIVCPPSWQRLAP